MNNKGFAFSTMLYGFMIIGCLIFLIILGLMSTNRTNTREMVNLIEDESARLSLASKTFTKNENGKDYRDYDVPLGFSGWYKIELWGNKKYSATTVYLSELTVIRFFIGNDSKDTYACSPNTFTNNIPSSFNTEGEAEDAYNGIEIENIYTSAICINGKKALIISTADVGNKIIKQIGDGITKNPNGKFSILNFVINAKTSDAKPRKNTVTNIATSGAKARITYVSNADNLNNGSTAAGDVCSAGHGGVYYIKDGSNFWVSNSSSSKTTGSFTGNNNQKWLIQCTFGSSFTCKASNIFSNYKQNNFSCSGKTLYNAGF